MTARQQVLTRYVPQWFRSPLNLPEAKSGRISIKHRIVKPGETLYVVGQRQAILRGQTPIRADVKEPLVIHQLIEDQRGVWMTDLPEELNQMAEMLHTVQPYGNVLVGGLGLGVITAMLVGSPTTDTAGWPGVEKLTVVERNAHVIKLCRQPGYEVVQSDITAYLRKEQVGFDFYLLDTWQGTNEGEWFSTVMPLRRIIRNRWGRRPVIHCWAEDIMHGQLFRSLTSKQPHWWYKYLPVPMSEREALGFLNNVGLPMWEKRYGAAMDRCRAEFEAKYGKDNA